MTQRDEAIELIARALSPYDSPAFDADYMEAAAALYDRLAPLIAGDAHRSGWNEAIEEAAKVADRKGWPGSMSEERYAGLSERAEATMDCADEIAAAIRALAKEGDSET